MALLLSTIPTTTNLGLKLLHNNRVSYAQGNPETTRYFSTGKVTFQSVRNSQNHDGKKYSFTCLAAKDQTTVEMKQENDDGKVVTVKSKGNIQRDREPVLSEGTDEDEKYGPICPGCGVFMQDIEPNRPGYYQERKVAIEEEISEEDEGFEVLDYEEGEEEGFVDDVEGDFQGTESEDDKVAKWDRIDWDPEELRKLMEGVDGDDELDGFTPAGVGYGNVTEEYVEKRKRMKVSKTEKKKIARETQRDKDEVTVCARCHSLRHYGQVKSQTAENLIPDFDFDRLIATRLIAT